MYQLFPQVSYYYTWNLLLLLGLGYHRDPQTRAAFMEVLTKILQQGTEFETLAETALADRFEVVNKYTLYFLTYTFVRYACILCYYLSTFQIRTISGVGDNDW